MLELIHEATDLWVLNKPSNVSLLRDRQGDADLWTHLNDTLGKGYLVHRLDKGTSGVLLVARTQQRQRELTRAFAAHRVRKFYLAWVVGHFPAGSTVTINLPLCKGRKSRYRVAAPRENISLEGRQYLVAQDREGVAAITRARTLHTAEQHSLVLLQPQHGRTHQLRVHLSWIGFPIVGDHLYGRKSDPAQAHERLLLHCHAIHAPGVSVKAPLSEQFQPLQSQTSKEDYS